ncbi:PIF1-like helicase [Fragilaria crotonensis]|nr:PIF1-like helicase [Fragilaria crotonensis]
MTHDVEVVRSLTTKPVTLDINIAHGLLGHPDTRTVKAMAARQNWTLTGSVLPCGSSALAKARAKAVLKTTLTKAKHPGERLFLDTSGPFSDSLNSNRYWLRIVLDDHTRFCWNSFLPCKSGIHVPLEALLISNKAAGKACDTTDPYTARFGADVKPNRILDYLQLFGRIAYVTDRTKIKSKQDAKASRCVFVGYANDRSGYTCKFYNPATKHTILSHDVHQWMEWHRRITATDYLALFDELKSRLLKTDSVIIPPSPVIPILSDTDVGVADDLWELPGLVPNPTTEELANATTTARVDPSRIFYCTFYAPVQHRPNHSTPMQRRTTTPEIHRAPATNNQPACLSHLVTTSLKIRCYVAAPPQIQTTKKWRMLSRRLHPLPFFYRLLIRRRNYMRLKIRWSPPRLIWSDFVAELTHQNEFNIAFRMSLASFNKLLDLVRPALTVDELQSRRASSGRKPVMPELVVAMPLRWLAGGQWQDIKKVYGLSRSHFYFLQLKFIHAVMASPVLEITLPDSSDIDALKKLSSQFESNKDVTRSDVAGSLGEIFCLSLTPFENQQGASFLRDKILSYIEKNGFRRPAYNRLRNDSLNFEEYEREFQLM